MKNTRNAFRSHPRRPAAASLPIVLLAGLATAQSTRTPAEIPPFADVKTPPIAAAKEDGAPKVAAIEIESVATSRAKLESRAGAKPRIDRSHVAWSDGGDGRTWARGASYKASFGTDGATYVPFLGACAPRNFPVELRLVEVRGSNGAIAFDAAAAPSRDGDRVRFDRGALVETYDLTPGQMEQSFTFASRPAAGGARLSIAVESELESRAVEGGLRFENALGAVSLRDVVAIDARGERTQLALARTSDGFAIDVPASVLDAAAYPLTIDPVITTFPIDVSAADSFDTDVAWLWNYDSFCTVYEEAFSAIDHDVYAMVCDAYTLAIGGYYLDETPAYWCKPKVAGCVTSGEFLVVAEVGGPGSRAIQSRIVHGNGTGMGAIVPLSDPALGEAIDPDVGGDPNPAAPSYFCVTWERVYSSTDHDVHARLVEAYGLPHGPMFAIDNSSNSLDVAPSISKSDGVGPFDEQFWTVVWEHRATPTDGDVYAARVRWDGAITIPTFVVDSSTLNDTHPVVSSAIPDATSTRPYVVAFERHFTPEDVDVFGSLMLDTARVGLTNLNVIVSGPQPGLLQIEPALDSDGQQFALTWSSQYSPGSADFDVYVATFNAAGHTLNISESAEYAAVSFSAERRPAIASRSSGGTAGLGYVISWDVYNGVQHDVGGAFFDGLDGGPVTSMCSGSVGNCPCGNAGADGNGCASSVNSAGANLSATGVARLSNDTLSFAASGMPATTTCLFFQGTSQHLLTFGDGLRCATGTVIRLGTKTCSAGAASFGGGADGDVSIKGLVPAVGGLRFYQAWYRNAASFCTESTFNLTNGLRVAWIH